jgi:[ribosomal protein S5]-alanine N-acetyltransferase
VTSVLQTPRVTLRRLVEADADNLFMLDHDQDVLKFTSEVPLQDVNLYRIMICNIYKPFYERYENFGYWAAEERAGGRFIGWFCLHPAAEAGEAASLLEFEDGDYEVGYRLRRSAWGKNYATEVTRALVNWAFIELGVKSIVAVTSSANLASIRVMEKVGLRLVDRLFSLPKADVPFVKYSLSRDGKG